MDKKEFSRIRQRLGKSQKEMAQLLAVSLKAIQSFEEALTYYEQHRVADRIAFVLSGLGELKHKMGQAKEGLDYLGRALHIYKRLGAGKPVELIEGQIAAIETALEDGEKGADKV